MINYSTGVQRYGCWHGFVTPTNDPTSKNENTDRNDSRTRFETCTRDRVVLLTTACGFIPTHSRAYYDTRKRYWPGQL